MKRHLLLSASLLLMTTPLVTRGAGPASRTDIPAKIDLFTMAAIPDGNYLVNLQIRGDGPVCWLNIECKDGALKCVNSNEPLMADWKGGSMFIGNGVFMVRLRGASEMATQFWVFRTDGTAAVKEVPDRGESQSAIPVKGTGLEKPSK